MKKDWWKRAVVYEIYPKSFMDSNGDGVGDIGGIIEKLEYLQLLGVDVLWIAPMYASPNRDNGYDISDYRALGEIFGTMEEFDTLLQEAHSRGLKIVMDLVVNHSSDQHAWFVESKKSRDNPYREYYIWRDPVNGHEPTNWGGYFGGSAWTFDEETGQYYLHEFLPEQPDLNWENPALREEIYDMMDFWCQKGIDGFRMDVISLISKPEIYADGVKAPGEDYAFSGDIIANGPKVHTYLREMNDRVLSRYDLMTVGEASCVTLQEAEKYANLDGSELNMIFQFEHVESLQVDNDENGKWTLKKMYLPDLKRVLNAWQTGLEGKAWNSLFWENHDQPRVVSRWGCDEGGGWKLSAKMLAVCLHFMKGTPYIYQGEELGMTNARFTELSQLRDVEELNNYELLVHKKKQYTHEEMMRIISRRGRDNARMPMQWSDEPHGGFTKGKPWLAVNDNYRQINARQQIGDPDSIFHFYRKLIDLRHQNEIMVYGRFCPMLEEHEQIYAYRRQYGQQCWLVICNFSGEPVLMPKQLYEEAETAKETVISNYDGACHRRLRPYEATVFSL